MTMAACRTRREQIVNLAAVRPLEYALTPVRVGAQLARDRHRAADHRRDQCAQDAGLGAILALVALAAVVRRSRLARPLVGLFNIEETIDLIASISLGQCVSFPL